MSLQHIKEKIHEQCDSYIQQRIETALQAIASVQAAGEEETKSSAGDKYETGREMMKQEIERHQRLLADAQQMKRLLENLKPLSSGRDLLRSKESVESGNPGSTKKAGKPGTMPVVNVSQTIGVGSLVQTDQGLFYLAIGVGRLIVEGKEVFVLSPSAPVGKLFVGRQAGDTLSFNGKQYVVLAVE